MVYNLISRRVMLSANRCRLHRRINTTIFVYRRKCGDCQVFVSIKKESSRQHLHSYWTATFVEGRLHIFVDFRLNNYDPIFIQYETGIYKVVFDVVDQWG